MNTGTNGQTPAPPFLPQRTLPVWHRVLRATRSTFALGIFLCYLTFFLGPLQRLVVFPLCWLRPERRTRILGRWIRFAARGTRAIVTTFAGVRIAVRGVPITGRCVVVMNHQSVLDIPIALCEATDPPPLIPVRTRYRRGIPAISPFLRAARYPFITQRRATIREDLAAVAASAARLAAGEVSLVFFPEGHRTRDGAIGPFMTRGLLTALTAAHPPVYCIVGDGMWQARTVADSLVTLAGTNVTVRISGPFMPPESDAELPQFMTGLRDHMVRELEQMRTGAGGPPLSAAPHPGSGGR